MQEKAVCLCGSMYLYELLYIVIQEVGSYLFVSCPGEDVTGCFNSWLVLSWMLLQCLINFKYKDTCYSLSFFSVPQSLFLPVACYFKSETGSSAFECLYYLCCHLSPPFLLFWRFYLWNLHMLVSFLEMNPVTCVKLSTLSSPVTFERLLFALLLIADFLVPLFQLKTPHFPYLSFFFWCSNLISLSWPFHI